MWNIFNTVVSELSHFFIKKARIKLWRATADPMLIAQSKMLCIHLIPEYPFRCHFVLMPWADSQICFVVGDTKVSTWACVAFRRMTTDAFTLQLNAEQTDLICAKVQTSRIFTSTQNYTLHKWNKSLTESQSEQLWASWLMTDKKKTSYFLYPWRLLSEELYY